MRGGRKTERCIEVGNNRLSEHIQDSLGYFKINETREFILDAQYILKLKMMTLILQTQNTLFRRKQLDIQQLLSQLNSIPIQTKSLCSQRKVEPWSQACSLQCAPENSFQNKAQLEL